MTFDDNPPGASRWRSGPTTRFALSKNRTTTVVPEAHPAPMFWIESESRHSPLDVQSDHTPGSGLKKSIVLRSITIDSSAFDVVLAVGPAGDEEPPHAQVANATARPPMRRLIHEPYS